MRSILTGLILTALSFQGTVEVHADDAASDNAGAIPSWKLGVSNFNGSGYELPHLLEQASSAPSNPTQTSGFALPGDLAASTNNPAGSSAGSGGANDSVSVAPYTVPVDPNLSNPYNAASAYFNQDGASTTGPGADSVAPVAGYQYVPSGAVPVGSGTYQAPTQAPLINGPVVNGPDNSAAVTIAPPVQSSGGDPIETQIASQLNAAVEPAPLQQEVVKWYHYPARWMKGWDSNAEFGIDGSNGNADTLALQTGLELKRKTDAYTLSLDVDYRQASSRDVTTEDNGRFNLDYDRLLGDSPWSMFGKFGMEWDQFKAFDLRLNINGGVGYHWIRTDDASFVTRFGAGASKEIGAPDDDWKAEAVFGLDAERQITSRQKIKAKLDYFPAWEDFSDYRLVFDASWEILLDGSDNLSLKLAATDRYDSTPQGAEANDLYYSLLLLYKF